MPAAEQPVQSGNPPQDPQAANFEDVKYKLSLGLLVVCPIIMLLPPRRLDLYTFGLGGMWAASANHALHVSSGRSILQRVSSTGSELPTERAREMQRLLREQREAEGKQQQQQQGVLERVWMGGEKEGWKERRLREEKEALEKGEGYGDLIAKQIWEVVSWDKPGHDKTVKDAAEKSKSASTEKENGQR